jgi:hypothetical protein
MKKEAGTIPASFFRYKLINMGFLMRTAEVLMTVYVFTFFLRCF